MKTLCRPLLLSALAALLAIVLGCGSSSNSSGRPVLQTMFPPSPFEVRNQHALEYELTISDSRAQGLELIEVNVKAGGCEGETLLSYRGDDLSANLREPTPEGNVYSDPVDDLVVFMWIYFPSADMIPDNLCNTAIFATADESLVTVTTETKVSPDRKIVISPPLRGGLWMAANGPANDDHNHRRTVIVHDGRYYIGERDAIDWMKLDHRGRAYSGEGSTNEAFLSYGEDIVAVADGVVVAAIDGIPDNVPFQKAAVEINLETVGGNLVTVDIGSGLYALYAHMIPGTVAVKEGERVLRGQFLGKLGNSGNSDAPHLHFQISNGAAPLFSQGLPYSLQQYTLVGDVGTHWEGLFDGSAPPIQWEEQRINLQIPGDGQIVSFD